MNLQVNCVFEILTHDPRKKSLLEEIKPKSNFKVIIHYKNESWQKTNECNIQNLNVRYKEQHALMWSLNHSFTLISFTLQSFETTWSPEAFLRMKTCTSDIRDSSSFDRCGTCSASLRNRSHDQYSRTVRTMTWWYLIFLF